MFTTEDAERAENVISIRCNVVILRTGGADFIIVGVKQKDRIQAEPGS